MSAIRVLCVDSVSKVAAGKHCFGTCMLMALLCIINKLIL